MRAKSAVGGLALGRLAGQADIPMVHPKGNAMRTSVHMRWLALTASVAMAAAQAQTPAAPKPLDVLDHGLRPSVTAPGEAVPRWSLAERMRHYKVPGVAVS